nr:MAG: RNA replicase beta chain [Sanya fiers-like virus 21]
MSRIHSDVFERVVLALCESMDTPRSLAVWLCFKYDHSELLKLEPRYAIDDPLEFASHYFITEYLSKYKGLRSGVNLSDVALGKWIQSEFECYKTNQRLIQWRLRPTSSRVEHIFHRARRKIAAVLGTLNLPVVLDDCAWGPGATFDLRRSDAHVDHKILGPISVTAGAIEYLDRVVRHDPSWASCFLGVRPEGAFCFLDRPFKVVEGSRFLTVAKNAKGDRCIAAEPTGNSFLQQGVHSYMRRRLKRFGVDLDDQSINQSFARRAFSEGWATLDLSAASDSVSTELVFDLIPLDWALFLNDLRSHKTRVRGRWVLTEKFASMGNAFCFELETLIFWALAGAVCEINGIVDGVSAYGDDIICPQSVYAEVVEIFSAAGFTVNERKSFSSGCFFESCGKHYHTGLDVTPVYQKELVKHPSEIIRAHNRLKRLASRLPHIKVEKALRILRDAYPFKPLPRIPDGLSEDGGFLTDPTLLERDPNHGYRCHVLDFAPRYTGCDHLAMYSYKLRKAVRTSEPVVNDRFARLNSLIRLEPVYFTVLTDHQPRYLRMPEKHGHASVATQGRWRSKVRFIPFHAVSVERHTSTC